MVHRVVGLEKLVDRYLRSVTLVDFPLHPRQHAYQTGKSTESALHQLVERVERALEAKQYSLGVFFDIERSGKLWRKGKFFDLS